MSTSTTRPEAEAYLAAVRAELSDLPDQERGELLEDLALHLAELSTSADRDEDVSALHVRLGAPAAYAAELRAAAGLPPPPALGPTEPPGQRRLRDTLSRSPAGGVLTNTWRHPVVSSARAFLTELRPGWWLVRGYLVVALPVLTLPNRFDDFPVPTVLGSKGVGVVLVLAAVVASVAVGRRSLGLVGRLAVRGLNAALVLGALGLLIQSDRLAVTRTVPFPIPPSSYYDLSSPHDPVTNIYPFSREGAPLDGVLLFDQDGRPLRTAAQEWWADGCRRVAEHPRAADGVPVEFSYPKRYVVAGPYPSAQRCAQTAARPVVPLPTFSPPAPPPDAPAGGPQPQS
jgi:hypothetical protein